MPHLGAFKNMFEEATDTPSGGHAQPEDQVLGRAESGFVGLDNQGATCYLNALLQALYMTPELRHGLYAVDPKELGRDDYEMVQDQTKAEEKARLMKERAKLKKHEKEGRMQPDPAIVNQLSQIFSVKGARRAALETKNQGFDQALEWALAHSQDPDFERPLSGEEDGDAGPGNSNNDNSETVVSPGPEEESKGGTGGKAKVKVKVKPLTGKKKAKMVPLELQKLFARLQLLDTRTVSTESLTEHAFGWKNDQGRVQHDAHELIRLLIDKLEKEMRFTKANAGLVKALYEGDLATQVKCLACGHVSETREKYRDIFLQVAGQEDLVTSLLSHTRPERLSGENRYFCDRCQQKQDALRSQALTAVPPLLIFTLNRFDYLCETEERVKVQQAFKYPLTLDMEPFLYGQAWTGNDNSDESQVPELAGDPDHPGTCRNRQRWIPQAWREAERRAGEILQSSPLSSSDERASVMFEGEASRSSSGAETEGLREKGDDGMDDGKEQQGLFYDLLAVVVHRGSAYSGHYHAFIKDCLKEGRWLPPSGFGPSASHLDGGGEQREQRKENAVDSADSIVSGGLSVSRMDLKVNGGGKEENETKEMNGQRVPVGDGHPNGDARQSDASARTKAAEGFQEVGGRRQGQGQQRTSAMELVVGILREAPVHDDLGLPCMRVPALRAEIRKRLGGNHKWEKLFSKTHGKIVDFLSANANTFLLQETQSGPLEVLLISGDEKGSGCGASAADELQTVLRMSLEQSKEDQQSKAGQESKEQRSSSGASSRGNLESVATIRTKEIDSTALSEYKGRARGIEDSVVDTGVVDALAAEKHGRWFSFDDRKVSPISILDLQKPFSGAETAYLLIYRSRSLDEEVPVASITAEKTNAGAAIGAAVGAGTTRTASAVGVMREEGRATVMPGTDSLHMTSVPPEYWMDRVGAENESLKTVKDSREADLHSLTLKVWVPALLGPQTPHLIPKPQASPDLQQIPRELRGPFVVRLDDRQTVSDLKKEIARRVGRFHREVGIPEGVGRMRLSELSPHGPGLFVSKHLPDMATTPRRRRNRRNKGTQQEQQAHGGSSTPSGESSPARPRVAALGEIEWNRTEDIGVLAWDGVGVGGVGLPDPGPEARPIRLVVSFLKPANMVDPFAWIDDVLLQAGIVPTVPERRGARAETCERWTDVYARAGVTAAELIQLVEGRGGCGGINPSKMCISVLRPSPTSSAEISRRRCSGGLQGAGGLRVEAIQIAGPEGVFQEWQHTGGGSDGPEEIGLGLSEGSELLVEEQGALSELISVEQQSLADMEAARRNMLSKVEVEVEDTLLENLKNLGVALAHDVALSLHHGQPVCRHLESDAHNTSITHLKARCLLSLAPGLLIASAPSSCLTLRPTASPVEQASSLPPALSNCSSSGSELALVELLSNVRLERTQGGAALDESAAPGVSLAAAKVLTGASLKLEWGMPPSSQQQIVRFRVRADDEGYHLGPLEVVADLKEPVWALKARMLDKAKQKGFISAHVLPQSQWRIRVAPLIGDSSTLVQEVKVADSKALRLMENGTNGSKEDREKYMIHPEHDTAAAASAAAGQDDRGAAEGGGLQDGEWLLPINISTSTMINASEGRGGGGKAKKKKKKPGGTKGKGKGKNKGLLEDTSCICMEETNGGAHDVVTPTAATAARAATAVGLPLTKGLASDAEKRTLFQDRLVEESGILHADEVSLEEGRVPKPLELEITVLAYAPHFLGFAVAAERSAERSSEISSEISPGQRGDRVAAVPTGLCENSEWPDREAGKKRAEVEKHRADPARMLGLERLMSMRTLGKIFIDERESLTELRRILREMLCEELEKAIKACRESAKIEAAAAPTPAPGLVPAPQSSGSASMHSDAMRDEELKSIAESINTKTKGAAKPKKRRNSKNNSNSNTKNNGNTNTLKGARFGGVDVSPEGETIVPLHQASPRGDSKVGIAGKIDEIRTDFADSDDEIPLPEGVPAFEGLEDAMLIRELSKDRLPGRIVRDIASYRDASGNMAGGLIVSQPISELHLPSTSALVLCLRPRLAQAAVEECTDDRRDREKLALELLENGQAEGCSTGRVLGRNGSEGGEFEESLEVLVKEEHEARQQLEVLETRLADLVRKREVFEKVLECEMKKNQKAAKAVKTPEHSMSIRAWEAWEEGLKARRLLNDETRETEERLLEREVEKMKTALELAKRKINKMELDKGKEKPLKTLKPQQSPGADTHALFTRVKGVIFSTSTSNTTFGMGKSAEQDGSHAQHEIPTAVLACKAITYDEVEEESREDAKDDGWNVAEALGNTSKAKSSGGKGGGKNRPNTSSHGNATSGGGTNASSVADERARMDEEERKRTDPFTNLHLWTFWRKNPLADGGAMPWDEPAWPGPLKEVVVQNTSQPTLEDLHQALGKAYGLPASRVWAVKHNLGRHEWVLLTPQLGVRKVRKKRGKKGTGGEVKRQVSNLREPPYSLRDGDIVALVDRLEDPDGRADLNRADDEVYRGQDNGQPKANKDRRRKRTQPKRHVPEVGLTLGDWGDDDEDEGEGEGEDDQDSDDLADLGSF